MRRAALTLVLVAAACKGELVSLGDPWRPVFHFGPAAVVQELAATGHRENPTLTGDLLEIYFTTNEDPDSNGDVWSAQRASIGEPFANAAPVAGINTTDAETSAAISASGLTLWFGSARPGGSGAFDIWVSERADRASPWSAPTNVAAMNTTADDIPRPPGQHELVMPMASTKTTPSNAGPDRNYQTYLASRSDLRAPFGSPAPIPEIDTMNRPVVDGFLTDDGRVLFFTSTAASAGDGGATNADLYFAFRRTTAQPFTVVEPLDGLNTAANERDPWMSPDGSVFYFTSDRDGQTYIYQAPVLP